MWNNISCYTMFGWILLQPELICNCIKKLLIQFFVLLPDKGAIIHVSWSHILCTIKAHPLSYRKERRNRNKTFLKQIVFVFPCNKIFVGNEINQIWTRKILKSNNENKWIKSLWQNDVPSWLGTSTKSTFSYHIILIIENI